MKIDGKAFRMAREKRLMTQALLSRESGVSPNTIKKIETGQTNKFEVIKKVLNAMDIPVKEAFDKRMLFFDNES
ncbi:MAG: helix-turn-helix domain-containing protein [Deltaproteobacteria bacterium]|jgi:transcriptional regulator with XRE-family HTH domain|nr:helix-turn-helix domain-containing protein [Deltaproteobacteria bacterium]